MAYTILVVEDTSDSRELMRFMLEAEGYRVVAAGNGIEAVEAAQLEYPDAILMDMNLPLMDGCQATRRIRELPELRTTPIIACTAYNYWDWRSKAILAGCTDIITKPFEAKVFLAMLSRYLQ